MDNKDEGVSTTNNLLRRKILSKRKDRGLDDIDTGPVKKEPHELTPEEIEKRNKRKAQNRKAATKFREKKKSMLDAKQQEQDCLIKSNMEYECKIAELLKELDKLKEILSKHTESGCCFISGHSPDNQGSNPNTFDSSPARPVLNPDTPFLNPDTPISIPDTSYLIRDTSVLNPDTPISIPDTSHMIPDTSVLIPDTSVLIPDRSVLIPDTSVLIPDTRAFNPVTLGIPETTQPQNLINTFDKFLLDLSLYDLERLVNGTNPHQYQMVSGNLEVNDFKSQVLSPNHDPFQNPGDCCLENEYDMSTTAENEQLSMFQHAQSQFSPVNREFDESSNPWWPSDESQEQYSFTTL